MCMKQTCMMVTFFHSLGESGHTFLSTPEGRPPGPPPCLRVPPPVRWNCVELDDNKYMILVKLVGIHPAYSCTVLDEWICICTRILICSSSVCFSSCICKLVSVFFIWILVFLHTLVFVHLYLDFYLSVAICLLCLLSIGCWSFHTACHLHQHWIQKAIYTNTVGVLSHLHEIEAYCKIQMIQNKLRLRQNTNTVNNIWLIKPPA